MDDLMNSLKNNNEQFSDDYIKLMAEYYTKLQNSGDASKIALNQPDAEGGMLIIPNHYCCIKTTDRNGSKIFINITSHDKIEAPKEENILEMENQYGIRLPMSLSDKYEDFDNSSK
jgi:hypothetical protein